MVMEAPPSPQSVGREFVRQYYTLLNKAPTHLHRFYNHQSSFVHGGLDPPNRETSPVVGQKQIHQKIQQLNFRDCHAKITQVDSQATLGNGVVVQVTGELSNAGQPMRRFTQTFVLAAQSPKKYYVHNDIFRYQDEIISDEECDTDTRSEPEEEVVPERQVMVDIQQINQQPTIPPYYPTAAPIQQTLTQVPSHHHAQPQHALTQSVNMSVNGTVSAEDLNVQGQVSSLDPTIPTQQPMANTVSPIPQKQMSAPIPVEEPIVIEEPIEEPVESNFTEIVETEPEPEMPMETISNGPKTWANLLKDKSSMGYSSQSQHMPTLAQSMRSSPPLGGAPGLGGRIHQQPNKRMDSRTNQQQQPRVPRQDSSRGMSGRNSINDEAGDDKRRPQGGNFNNDVNQLFLGNLPHNASEDDLREIFGSFGVIVDLRIHSKSGPVQKPPMGGRVGGPPNYGFITYESQQGVQTCLDAKPIYFPKGDPSGIILNVEEKKARLDRPSFSGRPNMDNRGRGDSGSRRGMGGGPSGPMRNSSGGGPNNGPNRNNSFNRGGGGPSAGPSNRGQNNYNRR